MPGTMSIPRTGPRLSAGVLTADLTRLGDELAILRGTGCWAHVDVMDGSFCPQLTVGPGWPGQPPAANTRRRLAAVRNLAAEAGRPVMVGVDGGVTMANAAGIAGWGADVVVSGSAIYDGRDPAGNLDRMLAQLSMAPERSTDDQQRPEREDRGPAHPDEDHPDRGGGP